MGRDPNENIHTIIFNGGGIICMELNGHVDFKNTYSSMQPKSFEQRQNFNLYQ